MTSSPIQAQATDLQSFFQFLNEELLDDKSLWSAFQQTSWKTNFIALKLISVRKINMNE